MNLRPWLLVATLLGAPLLARAESTETVKAETLDAEFDRFDKEFGAGQAAPVKAYRDPLRVYNRGMFWVNDKFYFFIAKPILTVYKFILPQFARTAVAEAFDNIKAPVRIVNHALTGHFKASGSELGRLVINSTMGVGGLWDPADRVFKMRQLQADFGQTMGHYGIGYGFPIVLPLLGQTNLRDGIGMLPESFADPVYWAASYQDYLEVSVGGKFNYLSLHGVEYEKIKKESMDPYTFIRDAHLQYRENRIKESRGEK